MKKKELFGRISKLTTAALIFTTVLSPLNVQKTKAATVTTGSPAPVKMRFMETTDLHSNVMDYDYYKDVAVNNFGLDRTAVLIKEARAEKIDPQSTTSPTYSQNSMLFDDGDLLQGNPLASYVHKNWDTFVQKDPNYVHPLFRAMKQLNYDAGSVGNHEFNYGLDYLESVLKNAPYSDGVGRDGIVNANIYIDDHDNDPTNDKNYFKPYNIIDKVVTDANGVDQHIKVGVIGFAPPQIMSWDKDNLQGKVITKDIVATANKFIPEMRAKGADIIVALAHSGCDVQVNDPVDAQNAENAVFALSKVPGVDVLLFGHAHVNFPGGASFHQGGKVDNPDLPGFDNTKGTINGTPAMEAGFWGNNLGVMDLTLENDSTTGKWKITNSKAALRPVTTVQTPDQPMIQSVATEHQATLDMVRAKLGTTSAPMYSYFAQVQDDPTIQIVNNAQMDFAKKWLATNRPDLKDIPVLSAGAPFKAGGRSGPTYYTNIATGDLSIKSANDLYLYDNTFKAIKIKGSTVREWLEMSAGQFNTVDPKNPHPQDIINADFQSYNFDVIDGVKYQVDITQKPRYDKGGVLINATSHRIVNLTYNGQPIDDNQDFIVATNNYRAGGGGNFPGVNGKETYVIDTITENREILMNYIADQGVVNPTADGNWSIKPVNQTVQMTFKSAPEAKTYADQSSTIKSLGNVTDSNGTWGNYQLSKDVHVQLLGINDFHGQLDTWRAIKDSTGKVVDYSGGIEYLGAYLKKYEAENPANTLMLSAGDLVGASPPVSALLQDEPTIRFMNELGFDVGTIGNHEFDEGVQEMKRLIYGGYNAKTAQYEAKYGKFTGSTMDYVVANVVDEKTNEPILPPYVVKTVNGVKIGFIGVVTTETPSIVVPSGVAGVKFTDEVAAINKYAKVLTNQGVKTIVVLAHDPGSSNTDGTGATGKVVDMAKDIDSSVDVIYGAHDHKYLNTKVDGKILVQSWSYGTAFSDVDLTIDPTTGDVVAGNANVIDTLHSKITPDAKIKAELDGYQADIKPITGQVVGQAADAITNEANQAGESALGNLIADGMRKTTGSDFAFMNSGGIRNPLPKGTLTWGDLFKVQPFGNDLVTMKITGEQVRTLLNQQFNAPPSYNKIMAISGLRYTWNDKLPIGQKVLDIFLQDGKKIDPKALYSITVNNFMADGGDGFTVLKQGKDRVTSITDLDAFVNYVKSLPQPISAKIEGRILLADKSVGDNPSTDNGNGNSNGNGNGNGTTNPTQHKPLPDTATNMYNYFFLGLLILSLGLTLAIRRRRLQA
jgi:2',3'-cyclic-nucleotide 2'-phosphodiesterase / 3'-nucleotidase / 5'-nucleotidase